MDQGFFIFFNQFEFGGLSSIRIMLCVRFELVRQLKLLSQVPNKRSVVKLTFYWALEIIILIDELTQSERTTLCVLKLSLIHISEPTRRTPISYAVFCLK